MLWEDFSSLIVTPLPPVNAGTAQVESAARTTSAPTAASASTEEETTGETSAIATGCWSPSAASAGRRKSAAGRGSSAGPPTPCAEWRA